MSVMRLLSSTDKHVRFQSFDGPSAVDGGYAILSHVWEDTEQPYHEMASLEQTSATVDDPRVSSKTRECRRLAETYDLPWFWIDTPCIDKRNSAELSEAIRSMYDWYAQASICFVYLADVERPSDPDLNRSPGSAFRGSAYFRRAWTLQELLAPRRVVFLYADWSELGDKHDLADVLEEITGIPRDVLTFRRPLSDFSVAHRLSWASGRDARRLEDKAYCLMGLFGIHMSVRYGERDMAFCRLQEEILKKVRDHTLLAWDESQDPRNPFPWPLAPSPATFKTASRLVAIDIKDFLAAVVPLCDPSHSEESFLPCIGPLDHHGIECRLPVLCIGSTPFAALLACREDHSPSSYLALALHNKHVLCPGVYDVGAQPQRLRSSTSADWPPSRLLRVNLELIAPLIASRSLLARVLKPRSSGLSMRLMSLRITTPSFAPSPTPTPTFDSLRRTSAVSRAVVQLVQNAVQLLPSNGPSRTVALLRELLR
ncbi:hypothetical protein VTO73DRAFT_10105 [Trametes versicolor]